MNQAAPFSAKANSVEHFDVLIVGAGISGVGSAYQLTQEAARHAALSFWRCRRVSAAPG